MLILGLKMPHLPHFWQNKDFPLKMGFATFQIKREKSNESILRKRRYRGIDGWTVRQRTIHTTFQQSRGSKARLRRSYFPVNFAKFFRINFLPNSFFTDYKTTKAPRLIRKLILIIVSYVVLSTVTYFQWSENKSMCGDKFVWEELQT